MARVALTFDAEHPDRPCVPGGAEAVLDALAALDVRVTFFVQGRWALSEPAAARRIAVDGHLVGNHSHHHAPFPSLTAAGRRADLIAAAAAIEATCGADPRPWFRFPFGRGQGDARIAAELSDLGYGTPVWWDIDTEDWDGRSAEAIRATVRGGVVDRATDAVVLLHTWPDGTRAAIAGIVRDLRDAGHVLVGVDGLTRLPQP